MRPIVIHATNGGISAYCSHEATRTNLLLISKKD